MIKYPRNRSGHTPRKHRLAALFLLLGMFAVTVPATLAAIAPASQLLATELNTYIHSGSPANASSGIALDAQYMLVADDEDQQLRLYRRDQSGNVVGSTNFTSDLGLIEIDNDTGLPREVDIEASARAGARVYWLGSHSNGSIDNSAKIRTNRYRLFATDLAGSGASTTQTFVGHYDSLRTFSGGITGGDLVVWGDQKGYDFSSKTVAGVDPESAGGFNIEGLAMAPNGTTAYIGFRAPLVGLNQDQALIAPLTNIDALVTGAAPSATLGDPIELDLGGRGIRSIERNSAGEYLIVAGPPEAGKSFQLYKWTGNAADAPVELNVDMAALNPEGSFEGIVDMPSPLCGDKPVQLLVDNGDLGTGQFRTITISNPCPIGGENTAPTVTISSPTSGASFTLGAPITFSGTATDAEDGDKAASLSWSYAGGVIGTGSTFARSDLPLGTHTITASATDSGGLSGTKQIVLTITAASTDIKVYLPLTSR
jgi:hypothetical protein